MKAVEMSYMRTTCGISRRDSDKTDGVQTFWEKELVCVDEDDTVLSGLSKAFADIGKCAWRSVLEETFESECILK